MADAELEAAGLVLVDQLGVEGLRQHAEGFGDVVLPDGVGAHEHDLLALLKQRNGPVGSILVERVVVANDDEVYADDPTIRTATGEADAGGDVRETDPLADGVLLLGNVKVLVGTREGVRHRALESDRGLSPRGLKSALIPGSADFAQEDGHRSATVV